jgi:hypothetical protein
MEEDQIPGVSRAGFAAFAAAPSPQAHNRIRSQRFSASSRRRDLNRFKTKIAMAYGAADMVRHDALILPQVANPQPDGIFGKDTQPRYHSALSCPGFHAKPGCSCRKLE